MNRSHFYSLLAALALVGGSASSAAQFKIGSHNFTLPDGFEIEQVAGPPLVDRPISASFDEQGRLYVTDSSGSNDKPDKQLKERPHRVVRLSDTNGDGRFDQTRVFADRMMFPEGCLWFDGALYVSAPPSVWKLADTNGDGIADQREEWHLGKTLTGCANDLHGPYLGPDGWIYWCKGAFAEQTYQLPNGKTFKSRASHIFRKRADGSGIEPVLTGGMDNPVSVAFTSAGERILVGTFFQHPEAGRRDGIIHAIYGGVYGKSNDVLDNHKKTGDLMPIMTHLGAAAACSVISYRSQSFGRDFQDNLFVCSFNMHKVTRHILELEGATFRTRDSDFLVSDNTDFHPTDVLEDADGSLLVVDTGGWYKICCPTSQLAKPDVLGAIYRIRRVGSARPQDPRGLNIAWDSATDSQLAKLLGDQRPAVRNRAIQQLAKHGAPAIPILKQIVNSSPSTEARRNAIWTLTRIDDPKARGAVQLALQDKDETVRHCAVHSISIWRDPQAVPALLSILNESNPQLQRVAAEALGRIGDKSAVRPLIAAASAKPDRTLEHSLIYALIEIDDPTGTAAALSSASASSKRAALIALDQMDQSGLQAEAVTPFLISSDPLLKQTAAWIVGHHPEWGGALAGIFRDRLAAPARDAADDIDLQKQLAQLASNSAIQQLLAETCSETGHSKHARSNALRAIGQTSLREIPAAWPEALKKCLADPDESIVRAAIRGVRALPTLKSNNPNFTAQLLGVGHDASRADDLRLDALNALRDPLSPVDPSLFAFLRANINPSKPTMARTTAAGILGRAKLDEDQLVELADNLKTAGPLEISKLFGAYDNSNTERVGQAFVSALQSSKGLSGARPDLLKAKLDKFPPSVQQQGKAVLAALNVDMDKQKAHLDELIATLPKGDIRLGQAVFNSAKAACSSCHAMGYLGGNVGPDLTSIGQIRTVRDLLEAIVYPSASFVRSYEPMIISTKSGDDYSGILRRDAPDEVLLVTGPNAEVRIARSEIAEMRPGTVSVMPAGLDEQLTRQELADLVAFLKGTKWGAQ